MAKSKKSQSKRTYKRTSKKSPKRSSKRSPKRTVSKKSSKRRTSKRSSKRSSKAAQQRAYYARTKTTKQCTTLRNESDCGGHPSCQWTTAGCRRRAGVLSTGAVYRGPILPAGMQTSLSEEDKAYIRSIGGKAFF